jgi:tRNA (mo5U34)-methyltransferase
MSEAPFEAEALRKKVEAIGWYHTIDLGQGVVTPGRFNIHDRLPEYGFPERLDGRTVLDVGAFDGAFSFEAERRGAARVVASDSFVWYDHPPHPDHPLTTGKAGFELARQVLGSRVEDREIDVLDLSPQALGGTFDLVLFLGVLYHMRDPMLALERVASVTGDHLILESHVDMLHVSTPAAAFYPGASLKQDPTNWWGPNPAAIEGMLRDVGFRRTKVVSVTPSGLRRLKYGVDMVRLGRGRFREELRRGRAVVHAWK